MGMSCGRWPLAVRQRAQRRTKRLTAVRSVCESLLSLGALVGVPVVNQAGERIGALVALRDDLLEVIESYRSGLVPLGVLATLLRHHATGRGQSCFSPYPDVLRLRDHVPA
jgi:hypothetical protein